MDVIDVFYNSKQFSTIDNCFDHIAERARNTFSRELTKGVRQDILYAFLKAFSTLQGRNGGPWNGRVPTGQDKIHRRSGQGLRDILNSIETSGSFASEVQGQMALRGYMAVHEEGAVIRAKRARYLTIPLPAALDSRGLPLKPSARDWPNTFVGTSRRGNVLIFQRRGRAIVPLYLLRRSVVMPARLRAEGDVVGSLPYFEQILLERLDDHVERML